ncbi:hypothetical protein [Caulobacter soli]|uniref:hypothetical protein n=1 Tax=Caulobacter soli TaxID=2708539 RepID=UPI0013EB761B|nr:hypothetical protein [Caulobacter soli]
MAHFLIIVATLVALTGLGLASQALARFVRRKLPPVLAAIALIAVALVGLLAFIVIAAALIGDPGVKITT